MSLRKERIAMLGKKVKEQAKKEDKFATQENPALIFQPLSKMPIIVVNLGEEDKYKTEPLPIRSNS
jgi:hypothetical protein